MTAAQILALQLVIDYLLALQPDNGISQTDLDGLKSMLANARIAVV